MNKRGTHVEVIISFVIFITFVMFLFAASRPSITKQDDKNNMFESLENNILEDVSAEVTVATINVQNVVDNCITIDKSLTNLGIGNRIIVKNSSNMIMSGVSINGGFITISRTNPADNFFKIYYSEEFNPVNPNAACTNTITTIGLTKTDKYVFQQKVLDEMGVQYNTLKTNFDVSEDMEFTFGMMLSNGTIFEKPHQELITNISTSIYVKDIPIEYVDLNGNILAGYLRTKIW